MTDNFIADACILMERGMTVEEVYSLIDHAVGLMWAKRCKIALTPTPVSSTMQRVRNYAK